VGIPALAGYASIMAACGYSLVAKRKLPKLQLRVRFSLPAPDSQASVASASTACGLRFSLPAPDSQVSVASASTTYGYAVFEKMVTRGQFPESMEELIQQCP
jgi:hypothetical protein